MNVTINRDLLRQTLALAGRSVASRATLPVLSHVRLRADGGTLSIAGTDLERYVEATTLARVAEDGALCVPARLLSEIVNALPAGCDVTLSSDARTAMLSVKAAGHDSHVKGLDAIEFPGAPQMTGSPVTVTIDAVNLAATLSRVAPAVADDVSRPVLTGMLWCLDGQQCVMAATDGFRLHVDAVTLTGEAVTEPYNMVIPGASVAALTATIGATGATSATMTVGRSTVAITLDGSPAVTFATQRLEGAFPDYTAIVPKTAATTVTVDRLALLEAVKLAYLFARESANIVRFAVGEGAMHVMANSAKHGDGMSWVEATVEGEKMEIAFNGRFVIESLSAMCGDTVKLALTQPSRPGLWTPASEGAFAATLMPMSIR